jgi:hypothetical protein
MLLLDTIPPGGNSAFRQALYRGSIFHLPRTASSQRLVAAALEELRTEFADIGPPREAQFKISDEEMFRRAGRLRKKLYTGPEFQSSVREILAECTFDPREIAFDPIRLRVVTHRGFENEKAAPIYVAHRDTWYANPQGQVTWWIPLHDVTQEETFVFFPDFFERPVPNNSELFDYDAWTRDGPSLRIGWQNPDAGTTALYPGFHDAAQAARKLAISCQAGDIVLFCGAHLHQTVKNTTGCTRFSVDFRTVHLGDHAQGIGAPNVDNRSTGSAVREWIHP